MRLRTFILAASALVSVLFFGGTYLVLDRVFEKAIQEEALQSSRSLARLTFNNMYELMSTGWSRAQLESFLQTSGQATIETPFTLRIFRGPVVESLFGAIEQPNLDDTLRQTFADGKELQQVSGDHIRYVFPLKAEQRCLRCHVNAKAGDVLGTIDVEQDIGPRLAASRKDFLRLASLVVPVALLIAMLLVWRVRLQVEKPLRQLQDSVEQINTLTDLRSLAKGYNPIGIREFDDTFAALENLRDRVRNIAVDKDILQFEIGLLEKFVITSDVVRDWREYVGKLLVDINQVITAHVLFSIFKIDDELFDLEVFWHYPTDARSKSMVEQYIHSEITNHPHFADTTEVRIHHHVVNSEGTHTP